MAHTGVSLTSFVDPFQDVSATERTHLPGSQAGQSHPETVFSPKTASTSLTTSKLKPLGYSQSLGSLSGYATSEEEKQEQPSVRRTKKAPPKKPPGVDNAPKVVGSNSSSDSDLGHQFRPSLRTAPTKPFKSGQTPSSHQSRTSGGANHSRISKQTPNMTHERRGNDTAPQKRTRSPPDILAKQKRPNTKGGFIVDDSESEAEDDEIQIEEEIDMSWKSAPPDPALKNPPLGRRQESKPTRLMQSSIGAEPGMAPLPTKQVNISRINQLLGRNKSLQRTPKQSLQPSLARPTNTKIPLSSPPGHPPTSVASQHMTSARIDGTRTNAGREQHPPMIHRRPKEREGLSKGKTATGPQGSMPDNNRKEFPGYEDADWPTTVERPTKDAANPTPTHQTSVFTLATPDKPRTSPRTAQMRQSKPTPSAKIGRDRKNGMANDRSLQARQPKSLLQATLDNVRSDTPSQSSGASGEKKLDVRSAAAVVSSQAAQRMGSGPRPRIGDGNFPSSSGSQPSPTPPGRPSAASPVLQSTYQVRISGTTAANSVHPQHQRVGAASEARAPQPNKTAQIGQPTHKRKADNISGGSGHAAVPSKKPAVTPTRGPVRPTNAQALTKGGSAPKAAPGSTPKVLARSLPTEAEKFLTSIRPAADTAANLHLAPSPASPNAPNTLRKQHKEHSATPGDRPSSTGVASPTQLTGEVAVYDGGARTIKPAPIMPQKDTLSETVPVKSISPTPRQATNEALPGQLTAQTPPKASGVEAPASSQKSFSVRTASPSKQSSSLPKQARDVVPTETPEAKSFIIDKDHGSTTREIAAKPTSPTMLNATVSVGSDSSKPGSPAMKQHAEDSAGSPRLLQKTGEFLNDTPRANATSFEAKKKPESVQQVKAKAAPRAIIDTKTTSDSGPSEQLADVIGDAKAPSIATIKPLSVTNEARKSPKVALTPPLSPPVASAVTPATTTESSGEVLQLTNSPEVSSEAQPYFEYSVFQKIWSSEQEEDNAATAELTVQSFTNIDEANAQAERLFQGGKDQHAQQLLVEWSSKCDEHGCSVFVGTMSPFDYPSKKSYLKIYVQRNCVSKFANQIPQALKRTTFVSSTGYALRLFKLILSSDAGDSDDSDEEKDKNETIRSYHPHSRPGFYTTLEAANRAARSLQIELSHEKNPTNVMTKAFQEKNLAELNAKVLELESPAEGVDGCWKSKFNASGLGGDNLELVVERAGICGPRNI